MKKASEQGPWDYYIDKQLAVLVLEMEFDFLKIAQTLNNITSTEQYTRDNCRKRWAKIHIERKQGKRAEVMTNIKREMPGGVMKKLSLREAIEQLPE